MDRATDPAPLLIEVPIRGRWGSERDKLKRALNELAALASPLTVGAADADGWTIVAGRDEVHLDAVLAELRATYALAIENGALQIAYRETVTRHAVHDYIFKGTLAPNADQAYARVKFAVEPLHHGAGVVFLNGMAADALAEEFAAAVQTGMKAALAHGPVVGFPVVDLRVLLVEASFHATHSSPAAFEKAAETGLREALTNAGPILTEPLMAVKVSLPADEALMVRVAADLEARRVTADAWTSGVTATVEAEAPLADLFGFAAHLKEVSGGRARLTMRFLRYTPVPGTPDDPGFRPAMALRPA